MVSVDVKHHVYHGNLLKSLVTMSRVTCFIKRAYKGSCLSFNTVKLNYGDDLENYGKRNRKVEISTRKTFLEIGQACMALL